MYHIRLSLFLPAAFAKFPPPSTASSLLSSFLSSKSIHALLQLLKTKQTNQKTKNKQAKKTTPDYTMWRETQGSLSSTSQAFLIVSRVDPLSCRVEEERPVLRSWRPALIDGQHLQMRSRGGVGLVYILTFKTYFKTIFLSKWELLH